MEINPDKCQEQTTLKIGNLHIKNSLCEKLLGINFDYKLNFAKHRVAKKHQESKVHLQDRNHVRRHQENVF